MALDLAETLLGSAEGSDESTRWASDDGHAARPGVVDLASQRSMATMSKNSRPEIFVTGMIPLATMFRTWRSVRFSHSQSSGRVFSRPLSTDVFSWELMDCDSRHNLFASQAFRLSVRLSIVSACTIVLFSADESGRRGISCATEEAQCLDTATPQSLSGKPLASRLRSLWRLLRFDRQQSCTVEETKRALIRLPAASSLGLEAAQSQVDQRCLFLRRSAALSRGLSHATWAGFPWASPPTSPLSKPYWLRPGLATPTRPSCLLW